MLVKLAWRNLWRNKLRTSIVLGAMIFGLSSVTVMIGFMNGMVDNMTNNAINWQTSHLQIHQRGYQLDPEINKTIVDETEIYSLLNNNPDIKAWTTRHLAEGMIASARSTRGITINGVDADKELKLRPIKKHLQAGQWIDDKGRNPIVVSQKTAERLKLRIGSKVVLTFSDHQGDVSGAAFRVRGIYKSVSSAFDEVNLFVRATDLKTLSGAEGDHEIAILMNELKMTEPFKQQISQLVSKDNEVQSWDELQPLLATMSSTMAVSNLIMLSIFVLAMGFAIVNILLMSLFERTREFGVLMAVGMQKQKIFALISLESTLLGLVGATLGLFSSLFLIAILQQTGINLEMVSEGLSSFGLDTTLFPTLVVKDHLTIFITIVITSFLAGLYPAWQILKQKPVDAMAEKH
ncbi:MAG: ABC transporter permease [Psychromonas sp.]|nr:ABC transporter permease [Psychromonas sp.]